ncbi:ornithine cyclodeaminase family protein [Streptomyces sp. NPDC048172]|uniref:ornithine cyclodeaminase family protein n=1 Tax=Streptomyces sp. NPDC048172 TaxID=3365505 RepID=UPI003723FD14
MDFERYPDSRFRHLTRADVVEAARGVDLVATVADALRAHTAGRTVLPEEAYLGWTTPEGDAARLLAMPGAFTGSGEDGSGPPVVGLKTINASLGNPARGIPRSQGFTLLLDPETARPVALMEAAYISAMRTAAVTALAVRHLAVEAPRRLALLGCGALAQAHVRLLLETVPTLRHVVLYDVEAGRAKELAASVPTASVTASVAGSAREAVRDAELVVPVTTVTEGYIEPDWLRPGALVCHVSLDDLTEAAVLAADTVVVDDWHLVRDDPRRLLGRMHRAGTLLGPDGAPREGVTARPGARRVDATLGEVLAGEHPGRTREDETVVSNPFGMSVLDVAVADRVRLQAEAAGLGTPLSL